MTTEITREEIIEVALNLNMPTPSEECIDYVLEEYDSQSSADPTGYSEVWIEDLLYNFQDSGIDGETIEQVADVIFYTDPKADETLAGCNPFAYFPNIDEGKDIKLCYSMVGQHSGCSPEYVKECVLATREEYLPLKIELVSIGYNLNVLNND